MTSSDIQLITSMAMFAGEEHKGQFRKELGEPYIIHPLRVGNMAAQIGMDPEFIAAAYGHDIIEDTKKPKGPLRATMLSLFPVRTMELVDAMTKWWDDQHPSDDINLAQWKVQYNARLLRVKDGALLKVLDRTDNLRDFARMAQISPKTHRWAAKYAAKTPTELGDLLPIVGQEHPKVLAQFNAALTALEAVL